MTKKWRYKLTEPFTFAHEAFVGVLFSCEWAEIYNGKITIRDGYAWDGCSPTLKLGPLWLGTPDGWKRPDGKPESFEASLVHDVLCQFSEDVPMTKEQVSIVFHDLLILGGFTSWRARIYKKAVMLFGPQKWKGQ